MIIVHGTLDTIVSHDTPKTRPCPDTVGRGKNHVQTMSKLSNLYVWKRRPLRKKGAVSNVGWKGHDLDPTNQMDSKSPNAFLGLRTERGVVGTRASLAGGVGSGFPRARQLGRRDAQSNATAHARPVGRNGITAFPCDLGRATRPETGADPTSGRKRKGIGPQSGTLRIVRPGFEGSGHRANAQS